MKVLVASLADVATPSPSRGEECTSDSPLKAKAS